jgi:hypothetical protein
MKRILIVQYSQSGQLGRVLDSLLAPLENDPGIEVTREYVEPAQAYPFPWPFFRFLDAFPESVYLDPPPLKRFGFDASVRYDLVILGYQVWYLSPSLPITGFLKSAQGRQVLEDTPVITVTACRNMWLKAQEKVKGLLDAAGAKHLDHVALVDQGSAFASFFTTPRWVWTGRKTPFWGFPAAGVSEQDIGAARRFGRAILAALRQGDLLAQAPLLRGLEAVKVDDRLIPGEQIAHRSFLIWGRLLRKIGRPGDRKRVPALALYVTFLILMIALVVLPAMPVRSLTRRLTRKRLLAQKAAFELPSGSESFRMQEFAHD